MKKIMKFMPVAALVAVASAGSAFAADLPKEGNYDFTSCGSGVINSIAFSKTQSAHSLEITGVVLSNPPGGMFDKGFFRCEGFIAQLDEKVAGNYFCESIYPDGKTLSKFSSAADGTVVRELVAGTGKYEGMVSSGTVVTLAQSMVLKPGTIQTCTHQTGTYKLK